MADNVCSPKKRLWLHLKEKYFDQIRRGIKEEEYREVKPYWITRLVGKTYDEIIIVKGYPGPGYTSDVVLSFPWNGCYRKKIFFPITNDEREVFAIPLRSIS